MFVGDRSAFDHHEVRVRPATKRGSTRRKRFTMLGETRFVGHRRSFVGPRTRTSWSSNVVQVGIETSALRVEHGFVAVEVGSGRNRT
jgi:hypothetical protein